MAQGTAAGLLMEKELKYLGMVTKEEVVRAYQQMAMSDGALVG